ncbi:MAG: hypothetical protein ABI811_24060 [Acidobacteriota bacterium]
MLLTDGNPNTTEALRVYESAILNVAHTELIDLEVKLGLATEEITQEVLDFLLNRSVGDPRIGTRRGFGVADVVVTRQMKRWHALHTLELVYRDGFNNQSNDRYKAKFYEYRLLAGQARRQTFQFGVGLVSNPVPVAEQPDISFAAGPFEATTYFVRVAWTTSTGAEGFASPVTTYDAPPASVPVVEAVNPPANATGFHVYLGLTEETVSRQTESPIGIGQAFILPGTGLIGGVAAGDGQVADVYLTDERRMRWG